MVTSNDFEAKLAELEQWFKQHKWLPENVGEFLVWLVHPIEVDIMVNGKWQGEFRKNVFISPLMRL